MATCTALSYSVERPVLHWPADERGTVTEGCADKALSRPTLVAVAGSMAQSVRRSERAHLLAHITTYVYIYMGQGPESGTGTIQW